MALIVDFDPLVDLSNYPHHVPTAVAIDSQLLIRAIQLLLHLQLLDLLLDLLLLGERGVGLLCLRVRDRGASLGRSGPARLLGYVAKSKR